MNPPGTPETIVTQVRHKLGTDRPLAVQYGHYLADLFRGDLGTSFHGASRVRDAVLDAVPNTVALAAVAIFVAPRFITLRGNATG
jgi:ABC-type dipeptide/oligopeptide/nickel transport system permease component